MTGPRVALVTGAARGIGRAIAARLLADGYAVALVDRDGGRLNATASALAASDRILPLEIDVAEPDAGERSVAETLDRFGRLDGLVNNAGIMRRKPVRELTLEDWRRVLDVNLTAPFLFAKAAAEALDRTGGAIVNIASTRWLMSEPDTEAYVASKGGLVSLTHALAVSLGPKIRVNAVSPGWIDVAGEPLRPQDHAQHPAGRVGRPEDVAELVAYLLDATRSGFVTGADMVVDGGMTRKMIYEE